MYHTLDMQKSIKPLFGHPVSKYWLRPCHCPTLIVAHQPGARLPINPYNAEATFVQSRRIDAKIFENHWNPIILVFIGKFSPSTFRWVPMCQSFSHLKGILHHFVSVKFATSSIIGLTNHAGRQINNIIYYMNKLAIDFPSSFRFNWYYRRILATVSELWLLFSTNIGHHQWMEIIINKVSYICEYLQLPKATENWVGLK